MKKRSLLGQLLAFLAAGVVVFTVVYIAILWRNQSPNRVLGMGAGHLLYQTDSMAIGENSANTSPESLTLLRNSRDGGWVVEGTGQWQEPASASHFADVSIIANTTAGLPGAFWVCVIQKDPHLTMVKVTSGSSQNETYSFHQGGIIEPILVPNRKVTVLGLDEGGHVLFRFTVQPNS